jgi:cytochrome oxidase Cu insertion factor (SCO1/SenC/PrrC family)
MAAVPPVGTSRRFTRPRAWLIGLTVLAVAAGSLGYGIGRWHESAHSSLMRASGIPSAVPTSIAGLMGLSPVPNKAAPDFTLVDQSGRTVSLSSMKGRSVVLEFMDPHCTDICPIVSQEFIDAYKDLGPRSATTVFVAVNVNAFHHATADMAAYSREQGLDSIPDWHFLTGPVPALQAVWRDYGVYVDAPNPNADVIHTSIVYFIDSQGRERFSAAPMDDHAKNGTAYLPASSLSGWGRGIALVANGLS